MNIILVNQFYSPSSAPTGKLLRDLAEALVSRGHRVVVMTSASVYGQAAQPTEEESDMLRIIRLGKARSHRASLWAKLSDYVSFFIRAQGALRRLSISPDLVVCMTTPPFCGLIGEGWWRKTKTPYALWCMDLYPEALVAHGLFRSSNPPYRFLQHLARRERRHARLVVTLGSDMTALVKRDNPSWVEEIPVWSEMKTSHETQAQARLLRRQRGWADDEIILLYSGNMGRAHRIDEFVGLALKLREQGVRFRMIFSGSGPCKEIWQQKYKGIIEFIAPVDEALVAAHLVSADLHLVSQQSEWTGVVVPSKFQASCAVGRPVVFSGPPDCAVAVWIEEHDCGWTMKPGDADAVARVATAIQEAAIRSIKGERASGLFQRQFTRSANCARLANALETCCD